MLEDELIEYAVGGVRRMSERVDERYVIGRYTFCMDEPCVWVSKEVCDRVCLLRGCVDGVYRTIVIVPVCT